MELSTWFLKIISKTTFVNVIIKIYNRLFLYFECNNFKLYQLLNTNLTKYNKINNV